MAQAEGSSTSDSGVQFKLGSHEAQIADVNRRLNVFEDKFTSIDTRFDTVDDKLNTVISFMARSRWSWKAATAVIGGIVGLVEFIEAIKSVMGK